MERYGDWAPTGFDQRGAFLDDRDDWLVVPVMQTRDSGPLAESNFESAEAQLEKAGPEDYENHRFGHWGPGWVEILIVRPGSKCAEVAAEIEASLDDYPVLDEEDYSRREWDEANDTWAHCYNVRERVELIREHNRMHPGYPVSVFAARHDSIPSEECGYIFERCRPEE